MDIDDHLFSAGAWLPQNIRDLALDTIDRLANASGQEKLGIQYRKEVAQGPDGPVTVLVMDYHAPAPDKETPDWRAVSRRGMRFESFKMVHDFYESSTHSAAVANIQRAVNEGRFLALYLRGFSLSASSQLIAQDPFHLCSGPSFATQLRKEDSDIQSRLIRSGVDFIIGIANPSDPTSRGEIPQLWLTCTSWIPSVKGLVNWCCPIIMFVERVSEGVLTELELIVEARKAANTIIVHSPPLAWHMEFSGTLTPPPEASPDFKKRWERALNHFTLFVSSAEIEDRFPSAVESAYSKAPEDVEPFEIPIPMTFGPLAGDNDAQALMVEGERIIDEGQQLLNAHQCRAQFEQAEDLLYSAAICAFFVNSDVLRACAYLLLGECAAIMGEKSQSLELYEWTQALAVRKVLPQIAAVAAQRVELAKSGNRAHSE